MAMAINERCTRCGDCVHLCPNDAIKPGLPMYRINPWLCTECLGFADDPHCAAACPVEAIEPAHTAVKPT
jgi:ferredoxin